MKTNKITEKTAISILNSARPRKGSYGRLQIAFDMAIKALEKQIPKKPKEKESTEKTHYLCPVCGYIPITIYADGYRLGNQPKYCEKCGQAMDWSVENE